MDMHNTVEAPDPCGFDRATHPPTPTTDREKPPFTATGHDALTQREAAHHPRGSQSPEGILTC